MTKTQMNALIATIAFFGSAEFTETEWNHSPAVGRLSLTTAVREGAVIATTTVTRSYYSVAEIVTMLNECSGEDCYGGHWHYEIDSEGRIYSESSSTTYHMA